MDQYTETTGSLARAAGVGLPTVARYAAMGLLDFRVAANGIKLFRAGQAGRVQQILRERLATRGRRAS